MNRDHLTAYLAIVVGGVWALIALVSVVTREYEALYAVSPVMLAVVGFFFGYRKNGNGNGKGH